MVVALAAPDTRTPRWRTGAPTRAIRCPVCEKVLGVVYGAVLVLQRGGRTIAKIGLPAMVEVVCVNHLCVGIWCSGPAELAC